MKVGDYFIRESIPQRIANVKGKYSTQFMSVDKPSGNRKPEDGFRMKGYDVPNVRKPESKRTNFQHPFAGHSEFWLG